MSTRTKTRWVHGVLAVLSLWPIVHIALVKNFDLSSWKLAGFGMYAMPQRVPGLRVHGISDGRLRPLFLGEAPTWIIPELERFKRHRRALGNLHPPDRLAEAFFANEAKLDAVGLVVVELHLDPESAVLEERSTRYAYERDASGRPVRATLP